MRDGSRRTIGHILCVLVLAPVWPLYFLRYLGLTLAAAMDWLAVGRVWTYPLLRAVERIEANYGLDASADHDWRRRWDVRCEESNKEGSNP